MSASMQLYHFTNVPFAAIEVGSWLLLLPPLLLLLLPPPLPLPLLLLLFPQFEACCPACLVSTADLGLTRGRVQLRGLVSLGTGSCWHQG